MTTFPLHFQRTGVKLAMDAHQGGLPQAQGLYSPTHEHDACGVGFVAHIKGLKSHSIVEQGLKILENLVRHPNPKSRCIFSARPCASRRCATRAR